MDVKELPGAFVIEVGIRQAWPFITFADNRSTPSREMRLYLDSVTRIDGRRLRVDEDVAWLTAAAPLNGETVVSAQIGDDGALSVGFAGGKSLDVYGEPQAETVGEPWWFAC